MNARKGIQDTDKLRTVQPVRREQHPNLALELLRILISYVSLSPEEFTRKFGSTASSNTASIFSTLKQTWADDEEATDTLMRFAKKPDRYKLVLQDILQEKLARDKDLETLLSQLLQAPESPTS